MYSVKRFFICFFVILFCIFVSNMHGERCTPMCDWFSILHPYGCEAKCGDCTVATPYCGYGECNGLGYNCIGGCRKGDCENLNCWKYCMVPFRKAIEMKEKTDTRKKHRKREKRYIKSQPSSAMDILMKQADKDLDGRLSMNESISYVNTITRGMKSLDLIENELAAMDLDKDGFLTPSEIDPQGV